MLEKIKKLERLARQLDPGAEQRRALFAQAGDYAESFLEALPGTHTYTRDEGLDGFVDRPFEETPTPMPELLDFFRREVDTTGILPASGGPFLDTPTEQLAAVTPAQACDHPNWSMGRKISVDSATLMNKGLEVIEARWLFNARPEQIKVLVHPQSIVHSMVSYRDGSVIAQLGTPDMRTPIANVLSWPERIEAGVEHLNLAQINDLSFREPDLGRFPCLALAFQAMETGDSAPAVLNAANEIAVEQFLEGRIGFTRIPELVETVLNRVPVTPLASLDDVLEQDRLARACAMDYATKCND